MGRLNINNITLARAGWWEPLVWDIQAFSQEL